MQVSRVDSLLAELTARHGLSADYAARLRPLVERLLEPGIPEATRPALMELLAETCERQRRIEESGKQMKQAVQEFFAELGKLIQQAHRRGA